MINTLYLKITDNCNMDCSFCFVRQKANYLSEETIKKAISNKKPKYIVFHGGEPTLYPSIILGTIKENPHINYSITSNLTIKINKDLEEVFKSIKNIATSYSVDRFKNKEKEFKIFKNNLSKLSDNNITLLITLSREQLEQPAEDLVETIKSFKVTNYLFERLYEDKYDKDLAEKTDQYLLKLCQLLPNRNKNVFLDNILSAIEKKHPVFPLNCKNIIAVLNTDGTYGYCTNISNIKTEKTQAMKDTCKKCKYEKHCLGDCCSFRDGCMFPKKTFEYLKEKLKKENKDYLIKIAKQYVKI